MPLTRSRVPSLALVVLALLAAQVLLAVPAGRAVAAGVESLTLTPPAAPVKATLRSTFVARLTDAAGAPEAGRPVALQVRTPASGSTAAGPWTAAASGPTDTQGVARLVAAVPLGARDWRVVSDQLSSPTISVTGVRLASTLQLGAPTKLVDERSATLTLQWNASDGTPVAGTVTVDRRLAGGSWARYATLKTGSTGAARLSVKPRVDSAWRATGASGAWWLAATSRTASIDNVPPGTPVAYPKAAPRPAYTPPQGRASGAGANVAITRLSNAVWRSMVGRSWHRGCPVGRSGLRLLRVNYWGFDGYRYRGEMVLATAAVGRAGAALKEMYDGRFPIRRMYRVDRFGWSAKLRGANDYKSMGSDNTSGFNCRSVVNKPSVLSPHARGRAVDLNTWENPYRSATGLVPNSWWASRSDPKIAWRSKSHPVVKIWARHGFRWTYGTGDSQHVDGRTMPTVTMGGFSG